MFSDPHLPTSQPVGTTKLETMVRAAWLYFMQGLTQQEIAVRMGLPRIKVLRLIKEAREQGLVEIKVHSAFQENLHLGEELVSIYKLVDAVVTPSTEEGEDLWDTLAREAAQVIETRLKPGMLVGLGLGRTLSHVPAFIYPTKPVNCTFLPLAGGLSNTSQNVDTNETLLQMARATGGKVRYFHTPFVVSSPGIRTALLSDETIKDDLEHARKVDIALFSVGTVDEQALLYKHNLISYDELQEACQLGAVGDALGRFYDSQGQELSISIRDRLIGLSIDELRSLSTTILVAGGKSKYKAIQAALRGNICKLLITDASTAQWLLSTQTNDE